MQITYCPAASAHTENFDPHIFADKHLQAVNGHATADGFVCGGIAFDDYSRMHTIRRKNAGHRRMGVPTWAVRPEQLREVIVHSMLKRAFCSNVAVRQFAKFTAQEKLLAAQKGLACHKKGLLATLDKLCAEYVKLKKELQPSEIKTEILRDLEIQIENLDTRYRLLDKQAEILVGCVYHYWQRGASSPEVAAALRIKPPHVRIIIWRLQKAARELGL